MSNPKIDLQIELGKLLDGYDCGGPLIDSFTTAPIAVGGIYRAAASLLDALEHAGPVLLPDEVAAIRRRIQPILFPDGNRPTPTDADMADLRRAEADEAILDAWDGSHVPMQRGSSR
jgi:hypothetical protein